MENTTTNNGIKTGIGKGRPPVETRFKAGNAGRTKGSRNRATILAEQLLDGEAEEIVRKIIKKAKQGDMVALRLCLDRLVPPRRDRPVPIYLPKMNSAEDASQAMAAITTAVARGELTPAEAAEMSNVVAGYVKAMEASEFERRLRALEANNAP